ncbi:MAG: type I-E CRISPR-associated protein Cas7/Cse4/CasC [Firmicutes bacterium]|nr:type I-E CRISPR-associated protein Cas7/Cse4/CasC [Bacillota bacterium]
MKNNRLYLDVHVLQTVPPSCVNRDDTGSPKTAVYGGMTRARVSSQSWKRAIRMMFRELFPAEELGVRTKKIVGMVAEEIRKLDAKIDSETLAKKLLENAGLKIKSVEKGTDALFFLSVAQAKALAKLAMEDPEIMKDKPSKEAREKAQNALKQFPGIDIALFGRMVADDPSLNTDACAQVAHSISTHKVSNEYDYFTAVDDLSAEDTAGAGHIGTVEFNSSTLYRYATVAVHELHKQLGDDTVNAVGQFVRAFVCSMPTGKQNTFANRTLPDAVLVTLREDQPINFVGAFEKPIPASDEGYVTASAKRLTAHAMDIYKSFVQKPALSLVTGEHLCGLGDVRLLDDLLRVLADGLHERLESGGDRR